MKSIPAPAVVLVILCLLATSCSTIRSTATGAEGFASEAREGVAQKSDNKSETTGTPNLGRNPPEPAAKGSSPSDVKSSMDSPDQQEGWAARNVPGWKALSALLPPPTEARQKWDEQNRSQGRTGTQNERLDTGTGF
jgi:hypothetical protein